MPERVNIVTCDKDVTAVFIFRQGVVFAVGYYHGFGGTPCLQVGVVFADKAKFVTITAKSNKKTIAYLSFVVPNSTSYHPEICGLFHSVTTVEGGY
jgi:hypothetical protein